MTIYAIHPNITLVCNLILMSNLEEAINAKPGCYLITLCFIYLCSQSNQPLKLTSAGVSNVFTNGVINVLTNGHLVPTFETLFETLFLKDFEELVEFLPDWGWFPPPFVPKIEFWLKGSKKSPQITILYWPAVALKA